MKHRWMTPCRSHAYDNIGATQSNSTQNALWSLYNGSVKVLAIPWRHDAAPFLLVARIRATRISVSKFRQHRGNTHQHKSRLYREVTRQKHGDDWLHAALKPSATNMLRTKRRRIRAQAMPDEQLLREMKKERIGAQSFLRECCDVSNSTG